MDVEDEKVGQQEDGSVNADVQDAKIVVEDINEFVIQAPSIVEAEVDAANQQAIGCQVNIEDFQLFLKFKNFLNAERQVKEVVVEPIPQVIPQSIVQSTNQDLQVVRSKPFITFPNGRVVEVMDIQNV